MGDCPEASKKSKMKKVSVIIPVYNEEEDIQSCLESLSKQTIQPVDIIVVDDGSSDSSKLKVQSAKSQFKAQNFQILEQFHQGPGNARNLGAKNSNGEILVFVDADMTFKEDFLEKLIEPIAEGKVKGTFTKEEYVSNWENVWARCWNYNKDLTDKRKVPRSDPDEGPVFRAILKSEFDRVHGFDAIGYTDDWTLSRKLQYKSINAPKAICYHKNPSSLKEVYRDARWIGKNEFISGTIIRRLWSLVRFNFIHQGLKGVVNAVRFREPYYIFFQPVYWWGLHRSIYGSFFGEEKYK